MRRWQERLDRYERREMALLSSRWQNAMDALEGLIIRLSSLEVKSEDQLFKLELYKEWLAESSKQMEKYAAFGGQVIENGQAVFAAAGQESAENLMRVLDVNFNRLPVEAINKMIGVTSEGAPLVDVLIKRYDDAQEKVAQTLIESIALGRNPKVTARLIGADMNGNLYNTLRIARTEQIRVMRETTRDVFQENSDIISGINLITEPDACEICLGVAEDNPHPLDYAFDELHPNCRCAFAPNI